MSNPTRRAVLAALAAFEASIPQVAARAASDATAVPDGRLARAGGAGGGAPVFSGGLAPGAAGEGEETAFAERAAILEHDGGWPRPLAEAIARRVGALLSADAGPNAWAALDVELIAMERGSH